MQNPFTLSFNELIAEMEYWEYRQRSAAKERHALVTKGGWSAADEAAAKYIDEMIKEIEAYLTESREALARF